MHKTITHLGAVAVLAALLSSPVPAAEVADEVAAQCGTCHQMRGPADETLAARQNRNGPPLFFAGNKFRKPWLEEWLQQPARLRPAGDYPLAHMRKGAKADLVDAATLPDHPKLDEEMAKSVAAYLMTLTPNDALLDREKYQPGSISERLGAMNFVKFQGCLACHKDTPKYGGVSGPELYTAWQRLQSAFIASYIRNPMAWEPRSLMPDKHLNDAAIKKLADYLKVIGAKTEETK